MSIADTQPVSYDQDCYAWLMESAALIQDGRLDAVDLVHLAEESEDMGRNERRALERYLKVPSCS
jgi:hypothetical protein